MAIRFDRALERATAAWGMPAPVIITANALIAGLAPLRWASKVAFYARDDWSVKASNPLVSTAFIEAYAGIRELGRPVAAVTEVLLDRIAPTATGIVVPNGVDSDIWLSAGPAPSFVDLPRPLVAYAGTLDDRLDVAAMHAISGAIPRGTLLLLGPRGHQDPVPALRSLGNVHYAGVLAPTDLAGALQRVDACVMPHRHTALTTAMSPLKIMDYLAAGRPVAASALPSVEPYGGRVVCVPAGGDWTAAVREALRLGPASEADRLRFVADHSWRRRHAELLDLVLT